MRSQDIGGDLAAQGTVDGRTCWRRLLADPYYRLSAPKSTGKEYFHARAPGGTGQGRAPVFPAEDLLATLVELTARTVADACRAHGT